MSKVRVYQLAKELNVQSALILELLDMLGKEVRSDLSMLDPKTAQLVRDKVTAAITAETARLKKGDEPEPAAPATTASEPAPAADSPAAASPTASSRPQRPAADAPAPARRPAARAAKAPEKGAPGAPPRAASGGAAPRSAESSGTPGRRVFKAQRIPTAAELARAKARATRGRGAPGGPPGARPKPGGPGVGGFPPPVGARGPGRPGPGGPGGPPPGAGRPGPAHKRRRKKDKNRERNQEMVAAKPKAELPPVPEEITLTEGVTVKELAEKLNRKSKDVIAKLLGRGVLATINQPLDPEIAIDVAKEFGSTATILTYEEEAQLGTTELAGDDLLEVMTNEENMEPRPPVVTVMGHVDHGKTSLLDAIRKTKVADGEAGGITQHIGAYQVKAKGRKLTFLDTPGHEAFTMMRARGAKSTDVVVLVVAADDGVKPQTQEAIDHAKAAKVPIVIAINKIDKPNANVDRVKQQLAERELIVEDYGGDIVSCQVSAKKREGIEELLEMILLTADITELKADPTAPATGTVLEARLDRGKGILATVLVQSGTLKVGDAFIAGTAWGKVRALNDENRQRVKSAGPSTPVEVMGFAEEPGAGDAFQAVGDEARARQISEQRSEKTKAERLRKNVASTLELLSQQIAEGGVKELPVVLKCDVQGSIEALQKSLGDLPQDKVRINVISSGIGAISQADVLLATASKALVLGFNVRPDRAAQELAQVEKVEMRMYTVIYELLDEIKAAMVGMLEPTITEEVLGQAEVRETFKVSRVGTIAGCYVTEGKVTRKAEVRLLRDNVVIHTGKLSTLRRFKDDVSEVKNGYECGIHLQGYNDVKIGDVFEFYEKRSIAPESL